MVGKPFPGTSPDMWSTPITGYGGYEGLKLPARGKAICKLPGEDLEYIEMTITVLRYDTGAAGPVSGPAPERRA